MSLSILISACLKVNVEYINNQSFNIKALRINIIEIKKVIIQRVIEDMNLWEELSRISRKLKSRKDLDIYIDKFLVVKRDGRKEKKE